MEQMIEQVEQDERQGFVIADDAAAEWALKKIAEKNAEINAWKSYYREALEKIESRLQNDIDFFQLKLEEYFKTVPHRETATMERYALPSGDLVLSKRKAEYKMTDAAAALEWCKSCGYEDFIKRTETPRWDAIKKHIKTSGEIPNGVELVETDEKFTIRMG